MAFAFCTCVEIGRRCVESLVREGNLPALLITLADGQAEGKSGRVRLDDIAEEHGIPLARITDVNEPAVIEALREHRVEWLFVVGWSQIVRRELLHAGLAGLVGAHPTPLPRGRGRAPIPWTIIKGLERTAVTFFLIDEGVDSGPIIEQRPVEVAPDETSGTLYEKVARTHAAMVNDVLGRLDEGVESFRPQAHEDATYWPRRGPEDGRLVPSMTVAEADRLIRACTRPYPGAFVDRPEGRLVVWRGEPAPAGDPGAGDDPVLDFADGRIVAREWTALPA